MGGSEAIPELLGRVLKGRIVCATPVNRYRGRRAIRVRAMMQKMG